jgi:hypothetical protein
MDNQDKAHFRYSLLLKEIDNLRSAEGVSAVAMVLIQLDGMEAVNERFGYLGGWRQSTSDSAISVATRF